MTIRTILLLVAVGLIGCHPSKPPEGSRPKLVMFKADWCGWCKRAAPVVAQIEAAGVEVERIDIDTQRDVAKEFEVTSVPTFLIYQADGDVKRTHDVRAVLAAFPWIDPPDK